MWRNPLEGSWQLTEGTGKRGRDRAGDRWL